MKINRCGQATVFCQEHFDKLIQNTPGESHKLIFRLAYFTAARMGEVVQLQTSDVYHQNGKPLDAITYQRRTTKTDETRQVPINPKLKEFLKFYWQAQRPDYSGHLFPGLLPGSHLQLQSADDALRRAITAAGLSGMGYSTHSFRRTAATNLANKGTGLSTIQKITGHSNLANLQRYIEINPEQVREAIATL